MVKGKEVSKNGIQPLGDFIIVRRRQVKTTSGGIVLPEGTDKRGRFVVRGEVIAVGPGRILEDPSLKVVPMPVKVGDVILFSGQAGLEMDEAIRQEVGLGIEEVQDIYMIKAHDIVAIIGH